MSRDLEEIQFFKEHREILFKHTNVLSPDYGFTSKTTRQKKMLWFLLKSLR